VLDDFFVFNIIIEATLAFQILVVIKPTTRFINQAFYMVLTLPLNFLYGLLPCTILIDWFCVTAVETVYCPVCIESLNVWCL
jgi:hypothetical protein